MESLRNNLEESSEMDFNDEQLDMFLNVRRSRSRSEESNFKITYREQEPERKNLILKIGDACTMKNDNLDQTIFSTKKISKKPKPDYNKNICGYITKKIIR